MAISDISLTAGMRNNLLSLQSTTSLINRTQTRLSSGKQVNTALDNPTNFFASQTHVARANDLSGRKDGMSEAVQMVKAADAGITGITALIEAAKGIVQSALATTNTTDRDTYAATFDTLLTQITQLASDSGYRGINFLNGQNQTVEFASSTGAATLQIKGFDATSDGLGISSTKGTPIGNLSNVSLVIRLSPQMDSNGDLNSNGLLEAGEGTEIDFKLVNTSAVTATNVSFANATTSTGWGFAFNTSANLGDVAPGSTVITDTGSDLDINLPNGTNGTSFYFTMDFTADGVTKKLYFGPSTVGSITNGQEFTAMLSPPVNTLPPNPWTSTANIQKSATQLEDALTTLRSKSASLSANLSVVTTRQNFTDKMISTLQTGADNLTLADMNQEGANMLMLQTRQNLGITSLGMAAQSAQAVMQLF